MVDYKTGDPDKAHSKIQKVPRIKNPMVAITGGRLFFIKYLLTITNKKTGKLSVQNLILLNPIKRKITGKKKSDYQSG